MTDSNEKPTTADGSGASHCCRAMSAKDVSDKQVVEAYLISVHERNQSRSGRWPEDILSEGTGAPVKVCVRAMERAERHGLIEYGVSLRSGWLTTEGLDLVWS